MGYACLSVGTSWFRYPQSSNFFLGTQTVGSQNTYEEIEAGLDDVLAQIRIY